MSSDNVYYDLLDEIPSDVESDENENRAKLDDDPSSGYQNFDK